MNEDQKRVKTLTELAAKEREEFEDRADALKRQRKAMNKLWGKSD